MTTTYVVTMTDSDETPRWLHAPTTICSAVLGQDSGRVRLGIETSDPDGLEDALDADTDVIEYAVYGD